MQDTVLDSAISNSLQLFADKGFKIRVIMRLGNPWFVASAACDGLALSNVSEALADLDDDDKLKLTKDEIDTLISNEGIKCSVDSRVQSLNLVSESGLYDLIMQSRKPEAKAFKRWVTHEVLPSIRKTGSYGMTQISRKDQLFLDIIHAESEDVRVSALTELAEINKQEVKALTAERDEAVRTKTQYQSNLAAQMSGRVGGLTSALNRVRTENDRLKGDILTVDDIYILMNISDVSFTLKDPKAVIRDSLNLFSKEMGEPFPKVTIKQKEINGKMVDVSGYVYTRKAVQAYFEFVEANPLGWQARNRKMIMYGWLREKLTISA